MTTKAVRDTFRYLVQNGRIKSIYKLAKDKGQSNNQERYKQAVDFLLTTGDLKKNALDEFVLSDNAEVLREDWIRDVILCDPMFIDLVLDKKKMTMIELLNILKRVGEMTEKKVSHKRKVLTMKGLAKYLKYDK